MDKKDPNSMPQMNVSGKFRVIKDAEPKGQGEWLFCGITVAWNNFINKEEISTFATIKTFFKRDRFIPQIKKGDYIIVGHSQCFIEKKEHNGKVYQNLIIEPSNNAWAHLPNSVNQTIQTQYNQKAEANSSWGTEQSWPNPVDSLDLNEGLPF